MSDIRSVGHAQHKQPTAQAFSVPPAKPTISLKPFRPNIPEQALDDLRARLNTAADILPTYENTYAHSSDGLQTPEKKDSGKAGPGTQEYECMKEGQIGRFGVTKDWLDQAIQYWRTDFDWCVAGCLNKHQCSRAQAEGGGKDQLCAKLHHHARDSGPHLHYPLRGPILREEGCCPDYHDARVARYVSMHEYA